MFGSDADTQGQTGKDCSMQNRFFMAIGWFVVLITGGCRQPIPRADLILVNGTFFTVNRQRPLVQAVAVKGGRILAVGTREEILIHRNENTVILDVEGKFGCPGFNDAHVHLLKGALQGIDLDLRGVRTHRELQRMVLARARALPAGGWIVGRGWDQSIMPDSEFPSRRVLDAVAPGVPVYLERICGQAALVNGLALRIAGITTETPDPASGQIVKDSHTGHPTGILKNDAMLLVSQYIPEPDPEILQKAIVNILDKAVGYGLTSLQDDSGEKMLPVLDKLREEGRLPVRIMQKLLLSHDVRSARQLRQKYQGPMLRTGWLTRQLDGSMGARSAAFFQSYHDQPDNRGIVLMNQEELDRMALKADAEGFHLCLEAVGDRANFMALNSLRICQVINGRRDSRHRIEHAQILHKEDVSRFGELSVVASMQPAHLIDDLRWAQAMLGPGRTRFAYAWKSLKEAGAVLAFGTDWPVVPMNPMLGLYAAVTRKDTTGYPSDGWFPKERISMEEALEAYTLGSAYAEGQENEKGSLEPGKWADIVILNQNLLEIMSKEVLNTEVEITLVGGKIVYRRQNEDSVPVQQE
ncbi:MAG TPA: amidohydrolase [bacterium]|nr:amidohydrolase [bacterium]